MPGGTRTFRVFVSSTFSDFQAEREALRRKVFPRLREFCRARAASFQAVDLRWGVSREAAESHQTMGICLKEIERCQSLTSQPNFIVLLGDRYGWRPLPEIIPADEFRSIDQWLSANRSMVSELFHQTYTRDDNAIPSCYRIVTGLAEHRVKPALHADLRLALRDAVTALAFTPAQRRRYLSSATEQEIAHRGLLDRSTDGGGAYCFFRSIEGLPQDKRARGFLDLKDDGTCDEESQQLMRDLKDQLHRNLPGRCKDYPTRWLKNAPSRSHIRQLCADIYQFLSDAIEKELSGEADLSPLDKEIAAHESFAKERQRVFIGRVDALHAVEQYLAGSSQYPFVVYGESGSGKSALLSRLISRAAAQDSSTLVSRFVGAVPGSTNIRTLLQSISRQLAPAGTSEEPETQDYETMVRDFASRMASAASVRPLTLFIDALDQLSPLHGAHTLNWLSRTLPDTVHVVVTTVPGNLLGVLRNTLPETNLYELHGMPRNEGRMLLELWLQEAQRRLQAKQQAHVLEAFEANGLPLYLRLAFEEARLWPSDAPEVRLPADVVGLLQGLFTRLAGSANHGAALVNRSLAYIAAGRDGLAQDELLDVLSSDRTVMEEFRHSSPDSPLTDALPDIIWSRLYLDLAAYLTERAAGTVATMEFFHRQLREVVEQDFLAAARNLRHHALATYFSRQNNNVVADGIVAPNLRKLSELPFQLAQAGMRRRLDQTLTCFDFIRAKVRGIGVLDLIEDFDRAQAGNEASPLSHLATLQEALRLSADELVADSSLLQSQLLGRLRGTSDVRVRRLLREAESYRGEPWLNPRTPSLTAPGGPLNGSVVLDSPIGAASVTEDWTKVLVGCQDGTLRLVDLKRHAEVRRWVVHTGPIKDVAYFPEQHWSLSVSSEDGAVICDLGTGSHRPAFSRPPDKLKRLSATRDGTRAVVASEFLDRETLHNFGIASLRNLSDGTEVQQWKSREGGFTTVALSNDGNRVITGTSWGVIQLWHSQQAEALQKFLTHDGGAYAISLAADADIALMATGDQSTGQYNVRLWDISKWQELHNFKGHHWMVTSVAITPDARRGASGAYDAAIRVWDLALKKQIACLRGHSGRIQSLSFSRDGKRLLSTSGQSLFDWALESALSPQLAGHLEAVTNLSVSSDGRKAVSHAADGTVATWDLRKHRLQRMESASNERQPADPLALMSGSTEAQLTKLKNGLGVAAVAATPDGRRAVLGTHYGRVHVWDLIRRRKIGDLAHNEGGNWTIAAVAISPDGAYALSGGQDTWIRLWDLKSRKCIASFATEDRTTCACATDGLFLAGSRNGAVHMLELRS